MIRLPRRRAAVQLASNEQRWLPTLLPAPSLPTFAATYGGIDQELERRTLGWVVWFALMLIVIGDDGRPSYRVVGESALAKAMARSDD